MVLIGSDFHPGWQQVSWLNRETGETGDQKLVHEAGATEKFYQQFPAGSRIGMEATGNCQWFLELMAKLGHEVLVGDAAKIRASDARQLKHDKRDARLLVQLLAEDRFPRIWVPSKEEKDLRQLLIHRYKLVRIRAQVKNGLQHLALNQGLQRKKRLWSEAGQKALCELPLAPWASRRREDLLKMQEELDAKIAGGPGQILGVLSRHSRPQAIFLVHRAPGNAEVARSRSVRAGLGFAFSFGSNKFPQLIRIS